LTIIALFVNAFDVADRINFMDSSCLFYDFLGSLGLNYRRVDPQ